MLFNNTYLTPDAETAHKWATAPETRPADVNLDSALVALADTLAEEDRLQDELAAAHARIESMAAEITCLCDELAEARAGAHHNTLD